MKKEPPKRFPRGYQGYGAKRPRRPPLGELLSECEAEGVRYEYGYATKYERHPLSQPVRAASSPKGRAKGASRRIKALPPIPLERGWLI